jgi:hypothetical protein
LHLEKAQPLVATPFQVQAPARRGGRRRLPGVHEALATLLSALGAAAGVRWINTRADDGEPLAVALIPGAQFSEKNGKTDLESTQA